jgi:aryl-alcohol dehydrogenase-like predicted oxidoreductase
MAICYRTLEYSTDETHRGVYLFYSQHSQRFLLPWKLTEKNWRILEALDGYCQARGHTLLDLAFSWLAANPVVSSVIAGATRPEQVEQNVAAMNWKLSPEELEEIRRILNTT